MPKKKVVRKKVPPRPKKRKLIEDVKKSRKNYKNIFDKLKK
jgi:hypothetical protein